MLTGRLLGTLGLPLLCWHRSPDPKHSLLLLLVGSCSHSCFLAVRNFLFLAVGYLRRNLDPSPEHVPWEGCCFPSLQSLACSAMFASSIHGFVKAPGGIRRAKKTPEHWAATPLCTGNYRGDSDSGITQGRMD